MRRRAPADSAASRRQGRRLTTIHLPLWPALRLAGPLFVLAATAVVLASPLAWPGRGVLAALTCGSGLWLWRSHLRSRPVRIDAAPGGGLHCLCADGRRLLVREIRKGVVRPWLASAELVGDAGRALLFVPGPALPATAHWQLRRALLEFRRGGGRRRAGQSAGRRGT